MAKQSFENLMFSPSAPGAPPIPGVKLARPEVFHEEPLMAEHKAFFKAAQERSTPPVPLEDGRRALAVALDIHKSMAEHHMSAGLDRMAVR
jgi:hypothetical protein